MSSPSTGIGWGVSWSQVVVGFCRTPSLQCGIFPTLGDIAYSEGHYWWSKRSATWDGEYPAMLELVHNVWNSSRPVVQHCPHCEMTVWNNLMSDFCHIKVKHLTIRNCQLWWKMWCLKQFLQTSHWQEYLVCGESKCPIDQVFSWHGLFINITASYRYNNGKGGFFLSYFDHFANELLPNPSFTLKIGSHRGLKCIEKILSEW